MGGLPPFTRASVLPLVAGLAVLSAAGWAMSQGATALALRPTAEAAAPPNAASLPMHPVTEPTALSLLTQPIPDTTPNAAQLRHGRDLVIAGDCMSCHLRSGGQPFAGGLGLNTPFGVIFSPNITSDRRTGLGDWTPDQFYRAMHQGLSDHGANLYPAFPYPWFSRMSRADTDAMLAYLKTTPPVSYRRPANKLPFPFNIRLLMKGWNMLFFRPAEFQPTAGQSAEWNRGAFLVNGPGHCGACHTPKNFLGADKSGKPLHGGVLDNWTAPDLTANPRTGLGSWSVDDVTEYLRTGRNARAAAGGAMAEVVSLSTSLMSDADRHAIAVYLKSQPASPDPNLHQADAGAMRRGAEIYSDACSACHLANGVGQPRFFPPLPHNAIVQQNDPTGVLHIVLAGSRAAPTNERPSPLTMPSFAWKLSDQEIADVTTYIRNSWGNRGQPVSDRQVRKLRKALGLEKLRYTANSGDRG
jgi:mono/diheme cytochrome c family protein